MSKDCPLPNLPCLSPTLAPTIFPPIKIMFGGQGCGWVIEFLPYMRKVLVFNPRHHKREFVNCKVVIHLLTLHPIPFFPIESSGMDSDSSVCVLPVNLDSIVQICLGKTFGLDFCFVYIIKNHLIFKIVQLNMSLKKMYLCQRYSSVA